MTRLNIKSPCYNCEARDIGCHSRCDRYREYKDNVKTMRRRQAEDVDYIGFSKAVTKRVRNIRRKNGGR